VVSSTPRPHFILGKDPVPIVQEAGWAPGPVWTGEKFRPRRDSIPDPPVRSSVGIATELHGPRLFHRYLVYFVRVKRPECDVNYSPPSSAEVKNDWS